MLGLTSHDCQILSNFLTHLVFRNGEVENLHAGIPAVLNDETMKILNKDINNRIYTVLSAINSGAIDTILTSLIKKNNSGTSICDSLSLGEWDPAELNIDVVFTIREMVEKAKKILNSDEYN